MPVRRVILVYGKSIRGEADVCAEVVEACRDTKQIVIVDDDSSRATGPRSGEADLAQAEGGLA